MEKKHQLIELRIKIKNWKLERVRFFFMLQS